MAARHHHHPYGRQAHPSAGPTTHEGHAYVVGPISFSSYAKTPTQQELLFFGDDHSVLAGNHPRYRSRISIIQYIQTALAHNPGLHVYAEISPQRANYTNTYDDSENVALYELRALAENPAFPFHDRIHNVDERQQVKDKTYYAEELATLTKYVKRYIIRNNATEIMPLLDKYAARATSYEEDAKDIGSDDDERDVVSQHDEDPECIAEKMDELREVLVRPMVSAKMIATLKTNPHNAQHLLFYTGNGHKKFTETYYLNPLAADATEDLAFLYGETANETSAPLDIVTLFVR